MGPAAAAGTEVVAMAMTGLERPELMPAFFDFRDPTAVRTTVTLQETR